MSSPEGADLTATQTPQEPVPALVTLDPPLPVSAASEAIGSDPDPLPEALLPSPAELAAAARLASAPQVAPSDTSVEKACGAAI